MASEHEMLVDHADAPVDCFGRRGEPDLFTMDAHGSFIGALHAEEDLHQR